VALDDFDQLKVIGRGGLWTRFVSQEARHTKGLHNEDSKKSCNSCER